MIKKILLILGTALLLCYAGFANYYPLTYPDTGTYIYSGFEGKVPDDRPIMYGLFLRHISLFESLYFVVVAQGILLAYLLFLFFKYFVESAYKPVWYVLLIVLLTFFTGASVNVSQLIPDIFTPLMILSLSLLVSTLLNKKELVVVGGLFVFSVSTHFSHAMICFLILFCFTLAPLFFKREVVINGQRLFKIWILFIIASLVTPSVHYLYSGHFRASNSSHVFLMNKLNEIGLLDSYLDKRCEELDLKICVYKDNIPTDFIWDYNNSPVYKTGGWEANKEEYNFIIQDILTTPVYLRKFLGKAVSSSISQFFAFNTGDTPVADSRSPAYNAIKRFFPDDIRQFEGCNQNRSRLEYSFLNNRQLLLVILSALTLFVIFSLTSKQIPFQLKQVGVLILAGLVANAIVCATLSGIVPRYQSRIIWLLPVLAFILLLNQRNYLRLILFNFISKK